MIHGGSAYGAVELGGVTFPPNVIGVAGVTDPKSLDYAHYRTGALVRNDARTSSHSLDYAHYRVGVHVGTRPFPRGFAQGGQSLAGEGIVANPVTGTGEFTQAGQSLSAVGIVQSPVIPPEPSPSAGRPGGWPTIVFDQEWPKPLPKPIIGVARFTQGPHELRGTGMVIQPVTGTARFTQAGGRMRGEGDVVAVTEDELMELLMLVEA